MERKIKRGDIYYADLNPVVGSEQGGTRPVLIISNDMGNKYSPTVIVAAITSRAYSKVRLPTHTQVTDFEGLDKESVVLLEQIRTLDKKRLIKYMGLMPADAGYYGRKEYCMAYDSKFKRDDIDELFKAILLLENEEDCYRFFEDICTINEIHSIAQRLQVARLLSEDKTYSEIESITKASTATISRINKCLVYGADGYRRIIERLRESEADGEEHGKADK